jgi:hypothetical protein
MESIYDGFAPDQLKAIRNDLYFLKKRLSAKEQKLIEELAGLSMFPPSRLLDAYRSAQQAARRHPNSAIIEFAVYKGGALAAMAYGTSLTKSFRGSVIGFDTFEGHTSAPLSNEIDIHGNLQRPIFDKKQMSGESWADCDMNTALKNYNLIAEGLQTVLPSPKLIKGDARDTSSMLSQLCLNGISLLRLDMDWYEPTKAALEAALPLFKSNAVLIVDDYGHHSGVRDAVDEFLSDLKISFDTTMTDYSCRRILFLS